jgi:hypothetical protein
LENPVSKIGPVIASSGSLALGYAERLLKDVRPEQFGRLARVGGQVLQSNHPAFIFGHLSLYPDRVLTQLQRTPLGVPPGYATLFAAGCECKDDADGSLYPPMQELTERFFAGYRAAVAAVAAADDAPLIRPNPAEGRLRELFPTLGPVFSFYLGGHVFSHLGQMSVWRRAVGLPPA